MNQTKRREETQQQQMEVATIKTKKIKELETKLQQQVANMARGSGGSIPIQVLAPISPNTSGGGSTTRTVKKSK